VGLYYAYVQLRRSLDKRMFFVFACIVEHKRRYKSKDLIRHGRFSPSHDYLLRGLKENPQCITSA
jgi:hypothetical protein